METTTYDTPDGLRLDVQIPAGSVTIQSQETNVTTLEISGERHPEDITITFDDAAHGKRLVIEQRKKSRLGLSFSRGIQVRVTVPQQTHLAVQGGSTELTVDGAIASVDFSSASGDATLDEVMGDARAKVASGDLSVGNVAGALTFHSASGGVRADKVTGEIVARTASGDVEVGLVTNKVNVTTVSGDVTVTNLIGGNVNLQAVSGDIEVGVAPGSNVYLDLSSLSGSTDSDLAVSDSPTPAPGRSSASHSSSEARLKAATVSGDIKVRHSSAP